MICPFCNKAIHAVTGFQEVEKFSKHLGKCRKNPDNHITDGKQTVRLGKRYGLMDALKIRAESRQ